MMNSETASSAEDHSTQADELSARIAGVAREHPLLLIAGGIAIGAVVAALLPKSAGSKLASRAVGIAAVAGELGLSLSQQARESAEDAARSTVHKLSDLSNQAGAAAGRASDAAVSASTSARDAALQLAKKALELAMSRHR